MGKTLKTVGMVIGAAALIATGAGAILMPGLAGGVTLFGVSAGTLNMVSAGLTAVGGLLDKPQSTGSGSPTDWTSNPDQPTPFAFGRVGVSGKVIHRDEYGKDNKLQGIVSVYSGAGPIRGFVSYKADDLPVSFVSNGGTAIGKYNRQMWRSWRLGEQPDTALSLPTGLDEGAVMPGWGAAYRLSGKACELLTVQQDSKFSVYPGGCPTPLAELDGIFGYDPRYDDTHPGGVGPCRLGIRATYRWIDNAIIAGLNWALGMVENGQVVGGIGASINGIDVPAFVEAANIADANDWKVTAWPDTSEDVSQVLKQFLQAGGASYARHAGKISCVSRGAARASIVTITARDTCGPLELDTGSSDFNRLNTITPEFMSAAHGWKHVPADPVTFASLRAEDGGKKSDSIQYRFVPTAKQAGQLAAYDILDAREPFSGTIPLKPHLRRLKRGDCFVIAEPGFLLDGVKCMVLSRTYDAQTGEVRIAFRSETDGKHDLALGKTATMPEYPALTPADPTLVSPPAPEDWVIVPRPPGVDGVQVPGFDLTGVVSNATATAIIVEYGPSAAGPWKQAYQGPPTVTNIPIDGLQPGATYYVAIQYQRNQNYSTREVYGPYTAPALIGDVMPNAPGLSQIKSDIEAAFGDIFAVDALLADARADLEAADAALGSAIGSLDTRADTLETQTASLEANKASVSSLNAQVARIDGVEAINATQALALIDLENGKVELSEYNTLKGEVQAARDGAPSLLGQIQSLKSVDLDLQANKASVSSVNALTAQQENTVADIIDLENALATETMARAEEISQLTARQAINPNQTPNGNFEQGSAAGWELPAGFGAGYSSFNGGWIAYGELTSGTVRNVQVPLTSVSSSAPAIQSSQIGYRMVSNGYVAACVMFFDGTFNYLSQTPWQTLDQTTDWKVWKAEGYTKPTAAVWSRIVVTTGGTDGFINLRQAKTEAGPVCTIYSSDASVTALSSSVTQQSLAIIDLENNAAIASWQVKAVATPGKPAVIQAVSSTLGSFVAFGAEQILFGDNTVFDDATDTIQTVWGSTRKVMAWGVPFGPDNLVEWTGPSSIALGSMTKANAGFWVDQTGAYGPTPLPSFWARVTPTQITRSRTGAGSISTAVNDVIVTCYTGTSGATCTWSRVSGDPTISFPATGFTPTFSTTVALGQIKTALFVGLVAKGGDVDLVYVNVEFQENT